MADADLPPVKTARPWWHDPSAIVFGSFVLLACAGILAKGWIAPPKPVDPTNPTEVPRGGSFCDPPLPVQSTLEKPK
jgi:hypothetical protein